MRKAGLIKNWQEEGEAWAFIPERWVITHDGKTAWVWDNPSKRIKINNPDEFAKKHNIISDDRFKPIMTYNED